jgi:cyanophycinase
MELTRSEGKLIAIGGAEDRENDSAILKEFLRLAKGPKARIVVMTVATNLVEEVARDYTTAFKRLGVDDVQVVDVSKREDAQSEAGIKAVEQATGIFFTGGDQLHITALLGGSRLHQMLYEKFRNGVVIAGTSAGASMMGNSMIISGDRNETPRFGRVDIGPGMDFMIGAIIDTHFSQRGRSGRLLTAVAHFPQDLGIGIDENTALVITNDHFDVMGEGAVTVIDAGAISHTNLPDIEEGEGLALYDVKIHVLPAGCRFNLAGRRPVVNEDSEDSAAEENSSKTKKRRQTKKR